MTTSHEPGTLGLASAAPILAESLAVSTPEALGYSGSFGGVVNRIERHVAGEPNPDIAWIAPRLIRGVMEPVPTGSTLRKHEAVQQASDIVLGVYSGTARPGAAIDLVDSYDPDNQISYKRLTQRRDVATHISTRIPIIDMASHRFATAAKDTETLCIPLCHGGYVAGAAMFLNHKAANPGISSKLYPVRFSMYKRQDAEPQLEDDEVDYLRELAQDRNVIITDEDISTGETIVRATSYFSKLFGRHVEAVVCNDVSATAKYATESFKKEPNPFVVL